MVAEVCRVSSSARPGGNHHDVKISARSKDGGAGGPLGVGHKGRPNVDVIQEQSTVPNVVDRGRNNMEAKKICNARLDPAEICEERKGTTRARRRPEDIY